MGRIDSGRRRSVNVRDDGRDGRKEMVAAEMRGMVLADAAVVLVRCADAAVVAVRIDVLCGCGRRRAKRVGQRCRDALQRYHQQQEKNGKFSE